MKKISLLTSLIIILCLSACDYNISPREKGNNINTREAILYLGPLSEPEMGFDPIKGWANVDGVSIFHSRLLKQNEDMNIAKDLAESYSISDDGKTYRFNIRKDAKFSNGEKVKSSDVKFTFDTAVNEGIVPNLSVIDSIEIPSESTLIINLKEPNSLFLYSITRLGIVPESKYGEDYFSNPIGSGPYKLETWEKGKKLVVKANPFYYGNKPKLDKLNILFLTEEEAFNKAKKGELDFYYVSREYSNENIPGMDLVHFKSADRINISWPNLPHGSVLRDDGLPVGNDITSDEHIRHAINVGINREEIVDTCLSQYGTPAYDLVDPEMPWYNKETEYEDNNIAEAKKILSNGGWNDSDGNGIFEKDGIEAQFDLYAPSDNKTYQNIAKLVAEQSLKFGIKINVNIKSWEEIDKLRYANPYILLWGSLSPINIEYLYNSENQGKGYLNSVYYRNDKVDEYIKLALNSKTGEEAIIYWKLSQWDGSTGFSNKGDAGWLWIASMDHIFRIKTGLNIGKQGIQNASNGWAIIHNIENWKWDLEGE